MKKLFLCFLLVVLTSHFAQAGQGASHQAVDPDTAYKNNCTRCHTSIQRYSPRMTKTIVMHMRMRANLNEDTAQAILEYLNGESEPFGSSVKQHKPADGSHQK